MGTIAENLLALQQAKADIKTAIEGKGQDLTDVPFTEYGNKITEISGAENLDTELSEQEELLNTLEADVNALEDKPKSDVQYMIDQTNKCTELFDDFGGTELEFTKNLDTSNVTRMDSMFAGCSNLISLDVTNFNTAKVTNMKSMFYRCGDLTSLDVSNFNTSNVTDMQSMFYSCADLTSLDLSNFDTSNVTAMSYMFYNCTVLAELNLSNFNTSKVTVMNDMFSYCNTLTSIDLSSFDTSHVTNMTSMFVSCVNLINIIGTLDVIKASMSSMFSSCTNLENVTLKNIKKSLTLGSGTSYGTKLTNATLINTIQQLWDLTGSTSQKLTLSTTSKNNIANIYVKLITPTAEQIEADPNITYKKPCEVCESTDDGAMLITEYLTSKNWTLA